MEKQRLLSGMQPTQAKLHLGNLEGALRNWVKHQDDYNLYCCVVDWHALTTMAKNPTEISDNARQIAMDYLAAGIDPDKSVVFIQSHVKEHAELFLLLSMITSLGKLERVPTYKEKKENLQIDNEAYGLLGYPVLQAADILLYKPYGVPVGLDQAPHLELSREIGRSFNHLYSEVFPEFKNIIGEVPTMLGLDGRKMSKSYGNTINIADTADETADKIKTAFTDPTKIRKDDPGHPDGCAVFSLHTVYNKENVATVRAECESGARGCVQCKRECTEAVNASLMEIRERRALLDLPTVEKILDDGADKARAFASQTMTEVRSAMGIR
ncbi:MAG: tryptophan--tRNA ligase [Fimbriimonadaceae bacterium]|nr:tryptophan--tRNA ligase [Fimbriimonadaceae bacterium]